jgi:hypothetical protein
MSESPFPEQSINSLPEQNVLDNDAIELKTLKDGLKSMWDLCVATKVVMVLFSVHLLVTAYKVLKGEKKLKKFFQAIIHSMLGCGIVLMFCFIHFDLMANISATIIGFVLMFSNMSLTKDICSALLM